MAFSGVQTTNLGPMALPGVPQTYSAKSTITANSALWWGTDSGLGGVDSCNNVIADPDVQQRAIPDEEILAGR